MVKMTVDGSKHTGTYQVACESCGDSWLGRGEQIGSVNWSPAMPVAEAVVHAKLGHAQEQIDVAFSDTFRLWLISYWERASLRLADAHGLARRDEAIRQARAR